MKLELLPMEFTVCQIKSAQEADLSVPYTFFARTDEEISLVCPIAACPPCALNRQDGWRCLRIAGPLDFSLVGILAGIAACLAERRIPIFAMSTFNTDYVLFRRQYLSAALDALRAAGYEIE